MLNIARGPFTNQIKPRTSEWLLQLLTSQTPAASNPVQMNAVLVTLCKHKVVVWTNLYAFIGDSFIHRNKYSLIFTFVQKQTSYFVVEKCVFRRFQDRWKRLSLTSINISSVLSDLTCLDIHTLDISMCFWTRSSWRARMKYFVWLRRLMREQEPPGPSHSMGGAPHVTTPLWPSSLLTSRSAFSHRHNNALLMPSEAFLIRPLPPYLI